MLHEIIYVTRDNICYIYLQETVPLGMNTTQQEGTVTSVNVVTIGTSLIGIRPLVKCVISTILQRALSQSPSLTVMSVSIHQ